MQKSKEHPLDEDEVQLRLDGVTKRLAHPHFLHDITPSRLPSQAASDTSSPCPELALRVREGSGLRPREREPEKQDPKDPERNDSVWLPDEVALRSDLVLEDAVAKLHLDEGEEEYAAYFARAPPDSTFLNNYRIVKKIGRRHPKLSKTYLDRRKSNDASMASSATASTAGPRPATGPGSFQTFDHGHQDLVLAVDFDFYGTRMVTASSDHRLKVRDKKDDQWLVVDTWRAHDAEIVDVKFNGPFTTPTLASIAEDSRLKLWAEDVLQTPNSSHRFRCIFTLRSETSVPFCSLAFKALMHETYLATITRDAYLAVYQPVDFDDLAGDWGRMEAQYVCATPSRAEETGFRVAWHAEKLPCWSAVEAGLDRQSLSLAVAAMDVVKIFRTDKDKRFYLAAELTGARNIIRDIGWANGAMRGYDLVAAASKDGLVRIYEISTPKPGSGNTSTSSALTATPGQHGKASSGAQHQSTVPTILEPSHGNGTSSAPNSPARFGRGGGRGAASAISTGLARAGSAVSGTGQSAGAAASSGGEAVDANPQVGVVKHVIKCVAEVGREHGGVWRLAWSFSGDLLVTSGDDGAVRAWKKSVSGEWLEAAQVEVEGG